MPLSSVPCGLPAFPTGAAVLAAGGFQVPEGGDAQ